MGIEVIEFFLEWCTVGSLAMILCDYMFFLRSYILRSPRVRLPFFFLPVCVAIGVRFGTSRVSMDPSMTMSEPWSLCLLAGCYWTEVTSDSIV